MKKNFMTRVLAVAMSAAMALSMATATNLTVAEAAVKKPAMKNSSFTVRVGNADKIYRANAKTRAAYKIVKAKVTEGDVTAKIVRAKKAISIKAGTETGKAAIKLTFQNRKDATAKKQTLIFKGKVVAAKVTEATIKEVKQTKGTELVVTLSKEVESVKASDFVVTRDDDNLKVTVSKAELDKTDKAKVTVTTYLSMVDGKAYTVDFTSAEGKQSSAKFTATDGTVASVAVTPAQVTANTATVVKYQTIDANGVVIDEKSLNKADNNKITYEYLVTKGNGVLDAGTGKVTLVNVGDTMDITVTYHTFKWANGVEEGAATGKTTITAVPSTAAVDKFSYTIATAATRPLNWARLKQNTRVCVDDAGYNLYARILDTNGYDITATCGYTVESSDTSTLLVTSKDIKSAVSDGINVVAVKAGSAYILVKDDKGNTVTTFPVETGAKRVLSTIKLDKSSVVLATMSGVTAGTDEDFGFNADYIVVTPLDQYNDYMAGVTIDNFKLTSGKNYNSANLTLNKPTYMVQKALGLSTGIYIRNTNAKELEAGTDYYTFDTTKGTKTLTSTFAVTWNVPSGTATKQVAFTSGATAAFGAVDNGPEGCLMNAVDTTVGYATAAGDKDQFVFAHIVEKKNSVITTGAAITGGAIKSITVRGPQGVIAQSGTSISYKVVTCSAITEEALKAIFTEDTAGELNLPIYVSDKSTLTAVQKKLQPGTYTVSVELKDNTSVGSATFTVSDSQAGAYATILETSTTTTNNIETFLQDPDNALFFYDDICYTIKGTNKVLTNKIKVPKSQIVESNQGKTIYVKNAFVTYTLPGMDTVGFTVMVPINQAFTAATAWA